MLIAAINFACGSSKTVDFNTDPSTQAKNLAYCTSITTPNINARVQAQTADSIEIYFDANLGNVLGSNILKFYKWYVRPDNTVYINPTPVKVIIRDLQTGEIVTGQWPEVSQAMVNEYLKTHGITDKFSLQQFMTNKVVVLSGVEMEYDALRLVIQNGTNQVFSVNTLIPAFAADPNVYAASHSEILSALHPNAAIADQGWSNQVYQQRTMSFCF